MSEALMSELGGLSALLDKFSGKEDELRSAIATHIQASGISNIADAYETMGSEAASLYIPMSRQAIRAKRDLARIQHEQAMNDLERREREAKVKLVEAQVKH